MAYVYEESHEGQQEDGSVGFVPARVWRVDNCLNEIQKSLFATFHDKDLGDAMAMVCTYKMNRGIDKLIEDILQSRG